MSRSTNLALVLCIASLPALAQAPDQHPPLERALNAALSDAMTDKVRLLAQVATLQDELAALRKQLAEQAKPGDKPQ